MSHTELTVLAAFLAGLMSSAHCLGMCGGMAAAVNGGARHAPVRGLWLAGLFNGGRVLSYGLAGLIAGAFGMGLGNLINLSAWSDLLRLFTGLIMIGMGLQFALDWRGLRRIESAGMPLWRRLAPLTRRLLPVRSGPGALALGALWGWLPCGLTYTMLLAAAVSNDALGGGALMLAFGAGTLPAMVAASSLGAQLHRVLQRRLWRRAGGALLIALGVWTAASPFLFHGHHHQPENHHAPADHVAH